MERSKSTVKSRTYKARIAAGYVVLLIASHVTEKFQPLARPPAGVRFVTVHTIDHGVIEPRTIRLAYRDSAPASIQTPVLLVHGSPGSGEVLRRLADLLSPTFRVIVPDLPGFGSSYARPAGLLIPCPRRVSRRTHGRAPCTEGAISGLQHGWRRSALNSRCGPTTCRLPRYAIGDWCSGT